jgi:hypothetical protein
VDDEKTVRLLDGNDLKFAATLVFTDPHQRCVTGIRIVPDVDRRRRDHLVRSCLTDPMPAAAPGETDRLPLNIVSDTKILCKTQLDLGALRGSRKGAFDRTRLTA